jgi:uncharacterized protein (TIGR02246 family)
MAEPKQYHIRRTIIVSTIVFVVSVLAGIAFRGWHEYQTPMISPLDCFRTVVCVNARSTCRCSSAGAPHNSRASHLCNYSFHRRAVEANMVIALRIRVNGSVLAFHGEFIRQFALIDQAVLTAELSSRKQTLSEKECFMTWRVASAIRAVVVAGLVFVASTQAMGQGPSPDPKAAKDSDREQITAIVRNWEEAWNKHDMNALAKLFHEDGIWILWTGAVWKGRFTIEEGLAAVHKTVYRNSIQRERIEELTLVGPDAAVVRFFSTLTGDERAPDKVIRSRKFLVVTKREGNWRIGWGQNTRLADTTPD